MFGKKKPVTPIDKDQLELIQTAQHRIKQKKRLYVHFVIFLLGAIILILTNLALGIGKDFKIFNIDWFVFAILTWLFLLVYHVINVFITHKFMGKEWEKQQLDKLVAQQKERIDKLKEEIPFKHSETHKEDRESPKKKTELTIIAAAGENDAIGKDNMLLWHLSNDLKRFKDLTNGHHIIMGRKTFESFGKPLPNRTHVVITAQNNYQVPEGVIVVNSLANAINIAKNDVQPFIIGGGEIYKQAMAIADKIELTRVHENFEGDTSFPKIDSKIWKETGNSFHDKDADHEYSFSYITYVKK